MSIFQLTTYIDAIAMSHGDPHGQSDGWDAPTKHIQQGETEMLAVVFRGFACEAGETPVRKTAFKGE